MTLTLQFNIYQTYTNKKAMTTFNYEINIEATTEAEADTKMKAITVLVKKLKSTELAKLAHIVQNDPIKTAMAKKALGV